MAAELCHIIENNGHKCFIAPRDIRTGFQYAEEIANGVDNSDAVLLVLTEAANNSPHVLREVERAVTRAIPILVYKVEEVQLSKSMEYFLMTHQWMMAAQHSYQDVARAIDTLNSQPMASGSHTTYGTPAPASYPVQTQSKEKKGKTNLLIAALSITIVVLIGVIVGAFIIISSDSGQNDDTSLSGDNIIDNDLTDENNTTDINNVDNNDPDNNPDDTQSSDDQTNTDQNNQTDTDQSSTTNTSSADVKLGDTIVMGTYNGEDMYWRVLKISDDGTEAVLVARDVISFKGYDAPDSGCYNSDGTTNYYFSGTDIDTNMELQAYVRGNSSWENSNIRTWLNSASESVKYDGQAPTSASMADGANGYNNEKGFLCNFTEEELSAIKTTTVTTKGNVLSDTATVVTEDKVFLLSMDELQWFEEANVSLLAVPTEGAIEKNDTFWYKDYCIDFGVQNTMWWLREPVEDSSCQCYLVGNGYYEKNIYTWEVGVESFGIRPAMTVDLTSD